MLTYSSLRISEPLKINPLRPLWLNTYTCNKEQLTSMKKFLILFLITIAVYACKDSSTNNSASSEFTVDQFPLTVGSTWMYDVYDSVAMKRDTLNVRIAGNTKLSDSTPATIWEYKYTQRTDTLYVTHATNTVFFYPSSSTTYTGKPLPQYELIFPFVSGNHWTTRTDSTVVISNSGSDAQLNFYSTGINRSDTVVNSYRQGTGLVYSFDKGSFYSGPGQHPIRVVWNLITATIKQ